MKEFNDCTNEEISTDKCMEILQNEMEVAFTIYVIKITGNHHQTIHSLLY